MVSVSSSSTAHALPIAQEIGWSRYRCPSLQKLCAASSRWISAYIKAHESHQQTDQILQFSSRDIVLGIFGIARPCNPLDLLSIWGMCAISTNTPSFRWLADWLQAWQGACWWISRQRLRMRRKNSVSEGNGHLEKNVNALLIVETGLKCMLSGGLDAFALRLIVGCGSDVNGPLKSGLLYLKLLLISIGKWYWKETHKNQKRTNYSQ